MAMELCTVVSTSGEVIAHGKYVLTALTLSKSRSLDIGWMPIQLTFAVVRMTVKRADHEAKIERLRSRIQSTVLHRLGKRTANVVRTADIRTID